MRINSLWLINFRNYENENLQFKGNTLIVGPNGSGKTSILEAIDILATTRSKIVKGNNKCIRHKQGGFIVSAEFTGKQATQKIVFKQERRAGKVLKLNEQNLTRTSELIGVVNSVIFLPNDIELIQGAPAIRRKYLDILISQIEKDYYIDLQRYQRNLKQRNELLKIIKHNSARQIELEPWDEQRAELNKKITTKRLAYIEKISQIVSDLFTKLGFEGKLSVKLATSNISKGDLTELKLERVGDIQFGHTRSGCHADDLEFWLDDCKASEFCSQGQQRLISLALKCAEAQIKNEKLNDPPLLLIDDVLLELDLVRLNGILREIAPDSQKIYTVTDTRRFDPELLASLDVIEIKTGKVYATAC